MQELLTTLWETWRQPLPYVVPACLLFAAAAVPFMSVASLCLAAATKRAFHDRRARQLAGLALFLDWVLLAGAAGLFLARQWLPASPSALFTGFCLLAGTLLLAAALLSTVSAKAWKTLRPHPVPLGLAGVVSGLCMAVIPALGLAARHLPADGSPLCGLSGWETLPALLPVLAEAVRALAGETLFFPLLAVLLFAEAAAGGGLALIWLALRRKSDDYGRDYYAFAARWCGTWGAVGGWGALIAGAGALWLATDGAFAFPSLPHAPVFLGGLLAPLFAAAAIWTGIAASATPMRHKPGMFLAVFCLLASLASGAALAQLG